MSVNLFPPNLRPCTQIHPLQQWPFFKRQTWPDITDILNSAFRALEKFLSEGEKVCQPWSDSPLHAAEKDTGFCDNLWQGQFQGTEMICWVKAQFLFKFSSRGVYKQARNWNGLYFSLWGKEASKKIYRHENILIWLLVIQSVQNSLHSD